VTFSLFLAFLGGISEEVGHNLVANQEVGTAEILAAQGSCKAFFPAGGKVFIAVARRSAVSFCP